MNRVFFDSYKEKYKNIQIFVSHNSEKIDEVVDRVQFLLTNNGGICIVINNKCPIYSGITLNNLCLRVMIPNTDNYFKFDIDYRLENRTNDGYVIFIYVKVDTEKLVVNENEYEDISFDNYKHLLSKNIISGDVLDTINNLYEEQKKENYFNPEKYKCKKEYRKRQNFDVKKSNEKESKSSNKVFSKESIKINYGESDKEILSKTLQNEIDSIIGLSNIKEEVDKIYKIHDFVERRKNMGIESDDISSKHMVFAGPPGTGKTTVARIMASIFYLAGDIPENKLVEVTGNDMQPNYVGQASDIVNGIIDTAKGGVLFIDEAYSLMNSAYSQEVVSILLKRMEDDRDDLIVIFAGYENDINKMLELNEGFKSRINTSLTFENYKIDELAQLLFMFLKQHHLYISRLAYEKCLEYLAGELYKPDFANGRTVRNLVEKLEAKHASNIYEKDINEAFLLDLIVPSDVVL